MRATGAALLFVLCLPRSSAACQCEQVPFDVAVRYKEEVVTAEVVSHPDAFAMEVRVLQVLKGTPPMRFKIWGGFTSCNPSVTDYPAGSVWAFVLLPPAADQMSLRGEKVRYVLDACTHSTRRLSVNPAARAREVEQIRVKAGIQ